MVEKNAGNCSGECSDAAISENPSRVSDLQPCRKPPHEPKVWCSKRLHGTRREDAGRRPRSIDRAPRNRSELRVRPTLLGAAELCLSRMASSQLIETRDSKRVVCQKCQQPRQPLLSRRQTNYKWRVHLHSRDAWSGSWTANSGRVLTHVHKVLLPAPPCDTLRELTAGARR